MAALFKIYPELVLPSDERAAMLNTRTAALVGADLAGRYGWKVGDRIAVGTPIWRHPDGSRDWTFDIVGIYRFKSGVPPANQLWMNYDYFSEAGGQEGRASMFIVGIKDSASADRISQEIDALFANSATPTLTQPERAWMQSRLRQTGNIRLVVHAIVGAVLFTLLALTANTMMESVRGRIAEFAVLKTFGYSNGVIAVLVVLEAMLLCLAAAACGLALAALAFSPVIERLGLGAIPLPIPVIGAGLAIAVFLALVSALPPVWRALRFDVAAALAAR
jgi:putative ABC transport system permease protein